MSSSSSRSAISDRKVVACPQCGTSVVWEEQNRYRPFCSERCKMIDLGAWATEAYRVPVEDENDGLEDERPDAEPPNRN
jgi:uncharacterized protein